MAIEIKDIASVASVLVALGLGVYNVLRTKKVTAMVDSLFLDDRRYELLQTTIDIETLRTRVKTSLLNLRHKLRTKKVGVSTLSQDAVQKAIDDADNLIKTLDQEITEDRNCVASARELTATTNPDPELIQKVNSLLGTMKARHSDSLLRQAVIDGFISDTENLLSAAELHTTHA